VRIPVAVPPAGRDTDVVGLGQNTIDHLCVVDCFPAPDAKQRLRAYEAQPGGQVATALVALARWGLRTAYMGAFGDDDGGRAARAALVADGVDVRDAPVRAGVPNQRSVILIEPRTAERTVLWHRDPALALAPTEVRRGSVESARLLHLDGLDGSAAVVAATRARAAGIPVVADIDTTVPETASLLPLVDVLLVSWGFARVLTGSGAPGAALARLAATGPAIVGVTLGSEGALLAAAGREFHVAGHRVAAVDSTGAGDVFHAGFIWSMVAGLEVAAALALANAAAALQCTAIGGRRAVPSLTAARALAGV
jgi:sugar/nucleoside kinase (ribokinase family)